MSHPPQRLLRLDPLHAEFLVTPLDRHKVSVREKFVADLRGTSSGTVDEVRAR